MGVIAEVKQEQKLKQKTLQSQNSLFSYVPDSVLQHKNNQVQARSKSSHETSNLKNKKQNSAQGKLDSRRGSARHSNNSAVASDRRSPSKFQNSPNGGRGGIKFDSETQDED